MFNLSVTSGHNLTGGRSVTFATSDSVHHCFRYACIVLLIAAGWALGHDMYLLPEWPDEGGWLELTYTQQWQTDDFISVKRVGDCEGELCRLFLQEPDSPSLLPFEPGSVTFPESLGLTTGMTGDSLLAVMPLKGQPFYQPIPDDSSEQRSIQENVKEGRRLTAIELLPRQPVFALHRETNGGSEYEGEKNLIFLDSMGRFNIMPEPESLNFESIPTVSVENLTVGWLGSDGQTALGWFNGLWLDADSGIQTSILEWLIRVYGKGSVIIRINREGEYIYVFLDHEGVVRKLTFNEIQQRLNQYSEGELARLLPEWFGDSLPAGGGEPSEKWKSQQRAVSFSVLSLLQKLRQNADRKEQLQKWLKQYWKNLRHAPVNDKSSAKKTEKNEKPAEVQVAEVFVLPDITCEPSIGQMPVKRASESVPVLPESLDEMVIKALKLKLQEHFKSRIELFSVCLGLSGTFENIEAAWQAAQDKGLLTLRNILKSLAYMDQTDFALSLLDELDITWESRNKFQRWLKQPSDEPPDLHFLTGSLLENSLAGGTKGERVTSSAASGFVDEPSDSEEDEYIFTANDLFKMSLEAKKKAREQEQQRAVDAIEEAKADTVLNLLMTKGPEAAEDCFRTGIGSLPVTDADKALRAEKAIQLIQFYSHELSRCTSTQSLIFHLEHHAKKDLLWEDEVTIELIKNLDPGGRPEDLLHCLEQYAASHRMPHDSQQTAVMRKTVRHISGYCPELEFDTSPGRSLFDILSWTTQDNPVELFDELVEELTDTIFGHFIHSASEVLGQLQTLESRRDDNESPLLSRVCGSRFKRRPESIVRTLQYKIMTGVINAQTKQDIIGYFSQRIWKDETEELLNLIATAGYLHLPLIALYPTKTSFCGQLDTVVGLVMDDRMNIETDITPPLIQTFLDRLEKTPLLLIRVNGRWLAAKGKKVSDFHGLAESCRQLSDVSGLQLGVIIQSPKLVQQFPEGRIVFNHWGVHSKAIVTELPGIPVDIYRLYLFINAINAGEDIDAALSGARQRKALTETGYEAGSTAVALKSDRAVALTGLTPAQREQALVKADAVLGRRNPWTSASPVVACVSDGQPDVTPDISFASMLRWVLNELESHEPDLDAIMHKLSDLEFLYPEFLKSASDPSLLEEVDCLYRQVVYNPMVKARRTALRSGRKIESGSGSPRAIVPFDSQSMAVQSRQLGLVRAFLGSSIDDISEDPHRVGGLLDALGITDLVQFLTRPQFQERRQQLAMALGPVSDQSASTGSLAVERRTIPEARVLQIVSRSGGSHGLVYTMPEGQTLKIEPSRALALVKDGRVDIQRLAQASPPYQKLLVKSALSEVDTQSRSALMCSPRDRMVARHISRLPVNAEIRQVTDEAGKELSLRMLMEPDFKPFEQPHCETGKRLPRKMANKK